MRRFTVFIACTIVLVFAVAEQASARRGFGGGGFHGGGFPVAAFIGGFRGAAFRGGVAGWRGANWGVGRGVAWGGGAVVDGGMGPVWRPQASLPAPTITGTRTRRTPITPGTLILTTRTGVIRTTTGQVIIRMAPPTTTATTDWSQHGRAIVLIRPPIPGQSSRPKAMSVPAAIPQAPKLRDNERLDLGGQW